MTADAKVGLLLGLVFIVIIAFLVNGLPNFFHGSQAAGAIETSVAELQLPNRILVNDEVSLPHESNVMRRIPPEPGGEEVVQLPGGAIKSPANSGDAPTEAPAVAPIPPAPSPTARAPEPRLVRHAVKEGETLTMIARRAYGDEIGQKKATIEAITKANSLKSPDVLQIGQVLVMPDLDAKPVPVAPASPSAIDILVEKSKGMLERLPKRKDIDEAKRAEFIEYAVRQGECLSEISAKHFGTSRKVDVIMDLNRDRIDDPDDVKEGTKLRLPKR